MTQKNALLVYPEFATSFWSFKFALQYLGRKSSMPSLGLLTLANMFSPDYNLRLVDMNVRPLTDVDLQWADLVCTSSMIVQRKSLEQVITRAKRAGKPVVAGGPHPTSYWEDMADVDYFLLGEVEETFPRSTPPCKPYTCLCPGVFHNRLVRSPLAGDAIKEHGRAHRLPCASLLHACNAPPVVRLPSPPARFSHDCNICSQNVTDGAGHLRYSVLDERVALQGISDVPGRQRYPCMEAMW